MASLIYENTFFCASKDAGKFTWKLRANRMDVADELIQPNMPPKIDEISVKKSTTG